MLNFVLRARACVAKFATVRQARPIASAVTAGRKFLAVSQRHELRGSAPEAAKFCAAENKNASGSRTISHEFMWRERRQSQSRTAKIYQSIQRGSFRLRIRRNPFPTSRITRITLRVSDPTQWAKV